MSWCCCYISCVYIYIHMHVCILAYIGIRWRFYMSVKLCIFFEMDFKFGFVLWVFQTKTLNKQCNFQVQPTFLCRKLIADDFGGCNLSRQCFDVGFNVGSIFQFPVSNSNKDRISFLFEIKAKFCHNQNPAQIMSDLWCAQTTLNVKMSDLWQVHLMQPFWA